MKAKTWFRHNKVVKKLEIVKELSDQQIIDIYNGCYHVLALLLENAFRWAVIIMNNWKLESWRAYIRSKLIDSLINEKVVSIRCGSSHSLVLTNSSELYGFGYEKNASQMTHFKIDLNNNLKVESISCGTCHCLLLATDGNIYAFGYKGSVNSETVESHKKLTNRKNSKKLQHIILCVYQSQKQTIIIVMFGVSVKTNHF